MTPLDSTIRARHDSTVIDRVERTAIALLVAFTVAALAGFAVFARYPERLASLPSRVASFYGLAFEFFAQGHIVVAGGILAVVLTRRVGWRWVVPFVAVYALSLASELGGTRFGVPFGAYSYGGELGPKWFGLVPVLIPVSWFVMALPSYGLARRIVGGAGTGAAVVMGSLILLSWDLSLDPAMSWVTRYWVWADAGPYYGMPLVNLAGWFVTGVALMAAFAVLRTDDWLARVPVSFQALFWGANVLLPLGMNAAAGLAGAVALGLMPAVLIGAALLWRSAVLAAPGRSPAAALRRGAAS